MSALIPASGREIPFTWFRVPGVDCSRVAARLALVFEVGALAASGMWFDDRGLRSTEQTEHGL